MATKEEYSREVILRTQCSLEKASEILAGQVPSEWWC